jgi:RimJ/RimL family protein N-acetyltransferase
VQRCRQALRWAAQVLEELVLDVSDPKDPDRLIGRFAFTIDYSHYGRCDGGLWLDPDTVAWGIRKNGANNAPAQ